MANCERCKKIIYDGNYWQFTDDEYYFIYFCGDCWDKISNKLTGCKPFELNINVQVLQNYDDLVKLLGKHWTNILKGKRDDYKP
jgi:hypothetical protein